MKRTTPETQPILSSTRYPPALKGEIEQLAKEHNRSFNGEVMEALYQHVEQCTGRSVRKRTVQVPWERTSE